MGKTDEIRVRVVPEDKQQAKEIFERYGLTLSGAVSMFIRQAIIADGLPFNNENSMMSSKSSS